MALSLQRTSQPDSFERHVRRLGWYTLLANLALLIPLIRLTASSELSLLGGLGALVIIVAVFAVIRDVGRYVQQEQARRRDAVATSHRAGACVAASTIQDRVANMLSLSVGYVGMLAEAEQLSPVARDQADRAIQAAMAASRAVSAFKQSLGCPPQPLPLSMLGGTSQSAESQASAGSPVEQLRQWSFDPETRSIRGNDGVALATMSRSADNATGMLITEAPVLWDVLNEAQHLGATLLAARSCSKPVEVELRLLVERINAVASRLQS
jgi:hypothetical protein